MPRPSTQGAQTREKILDVALELFTERGYDKTSLRDIAERLHVTKAALYYYFEHKEDILLELHLRLHAIGRDALDEFERVQDGEARVAAFPALLDRVIAGIVEHRELVLLHRRNTSAFEALHRSERNQLENEYLEQRLARVLGSAAIPLPQRVRMACAIGAVTETFVESGNAFANVRADELAALVRAAVGDLLGSPATV